MTCMSPYLTHLLRRHAQRRLHEVVGLAYELHVAILDSVVHHLHIVASAAITNPVAARLPVARSTDTLSNMR